MGCSSPSRQTQSAEPSRETSHQSVGSKSTSSAWTEDTAEKLQESVDRIFGKGGKSLLGLEFSFSIADPFLDGCPLIGCSTGFTTLCGYALQDIVGRNCRFLVDSVPSEQIDKAMRRQVKDFCEAVKRGESYRRPESELEPWMPQGRPADELLAMQRNARKDGTLFNNMFFLKVFDLSVELGKERPYIVALQCELAAGKNDLSKLAESVELLQSNMARVKKDLGGLFFVQSSISRQMNTVSSFNPSDGDEAPSDLHSAFASTDVRPWAESRFKKVKKLAEAKRNRGMVWLMQDENENKYAVKQMPNSWVRTCHEEFLKVHPKESELPWQDIGCTRYLNSVNYKYACNLQGVYRSDEHTFVVSAYAPEGDLFTAAEVGDPVGPKRESLFRPLVVELLSALKHLHDMQIVHRDISLENVLKTDKTGTIKIIDFGMAAKGRAFHSCPRGKASYEAPEMQNNGNYDAFLTDTFATGVVVYSILLKDYPWMSTKPGQCKCYDYVKQEGLRAYCSRRCVRGTNRRITDAISEPLISLLEGMLMLDPKKRLTLGEKSWTTTRKSVWDEPWIKAALSQDGRHVSI